MFTTLKYCIWRIWPYLGAYLSAPNMVKWGVPEKILQDAVETRFLYHNIANLIIPNSKSKKGRIIPSQVNWDHGQYSQLLGCFGFCP